MEGEKKWEFLLSPDQLQQAYVRGELHVLLHELDVRFKREGDAIRVVVTYVPGRGEDAPNAMTRLQNPWKHREEEEEPSGR